MRDYIPRFPPRANYCFDFDGNSTRTMNKAGLDEQSKCMLVADPLHLTTSQDKCLSEAGTAGTMPGLSMPVKEVRERLHAQLLAP